MEFPSILTLNNLIFSGFWFSITILSLLDFIQQTSLDVASLHNRTVLHCIISSITMDSKASYLSDPRCQCDFVVATSQASINSGLRQYLAEKDQPIQYICIVADEKGNPTKQISLEELKKKAKGADPFTIPETGRTAEQDKQLDDLADADFAVGIQLQMGMPPGVSPKDLEIVTLGSSADKVTFRLYCSHVKAVQLKATRRSVFWNVFEQPSGSPWSVQTSVDLVVADLDKNLSNSNYLKSHDDIREALRKQLNNLSGTAFSLQQLLFDLDNAVLETVPTFHGVEKGSDAEYVLQRFFVNLYSATAKEYGLPLVSVTAVAQPEDASTLHMTAMERIVSPLKNSSGQRISNPSTEEQEVTTLNYLCAVDNHPVPRISSFDWNWLKPNQIDDMSGVIAINRNIFAKHIADQLCVAVKGDCYTPAVSASAGLHLYDNGTPTVTFFDSGNKVMHVEHTATDASILGYDNVTLETYTRVISKYSCDVTFEEKSIRIDQALSIRTWNRVKEVQDHGWIDPEASGYRYNINLIDKKLTDVYDLSVDQDGSLRLTKVKEDASDDSDALDLSDVHWYATKALLIKVRNGIDDLTSGHLHDLELSKLQSFVFPGARVFTYKNPFWSDHYDLIAEITYLDTQVSSAQQPLSHPTQAMSMARRPVAAAAPDYSNGSAQQKLTASTELMQNYVQGEIVSPTGKFEALQTSDGHALLFAIDSSGVFHVVEEQSGNSHTGWKIHDLSTSPIQVQFSGQQSQAVVRTFDASQNADGKIGMMMTVNVGDGNDRLFVSLGNSSSDTSWAAHPVWTMIPFDPVNEQARKIVIAGTLFGESQDGKEYLVVDVQRPAAYSGNEHIIRYHVDPTRATGHYWVKHDVSVDIAAGDYQSCVGRVSRGFVDGIYTVGTTGGKPQFVYEPIVNVWGRGPPEPRRLRLPGGATPKAIATARNSDGSTDLYAIAGSTLYRFPSDKQVESNEPTALFNIPILDGTDTLRAMNHDGVTTLWGRNASNQVYYLACPSTQLAQADCWSAPVPILSGVERISPYLNRADGGNTIFAAGNGRFQKLIQGSVDNGRVWNAQEITIAASPKQKPLSFQSYTSIIHVKQDHHDLPEPNAVVTLTADSRRPVYINGIYYVVSPTPIRVKADAMGSITVVEATDNINGTVLTISLDDGTTIIMNPMDHSFAKLTALNSKEKLRNASFPGQTVAGGVLGSPASNPLVPTSTADEVVDAVAKHLGILKDSYSNAKAPNNTTKAIRALVQRNHGIVSSRMFRAGTMGVSRLNFFGDMWHHVTVAWGDLTQWVKNTAQDIVHTIGDTIKDFVDDVKHIAQIVHDELSDTLHFLVQIGETVYHAVLDTVDAVVGAMEWVFKAVKTAIQDIMNFLNMIFEWDDIRRTKDVLHNLTKLWMQHQVDKIPLVRDGFDRVIKEVEGTVNRLTGITDWSPLGGDMHKPAAANAVNPLKGQTSSSQMLANQYKNHAQELQILGEIPGADGVLTLLDDLLTAIINEGAVLGSVLDQLLKLSSEFSSLSVVDVLKRIMGILVDGVLSSVQVVVDALLNVFYRMAQSIVTLLDTKIHIPVISDILNTIGVPDVSFLDLFSWIIAMCYTVAYKVTNGHAPFPGNDGTVSAMITSDNLDDLARHFGQKTRTSFAKQSGSYATGHPSTIITISESSVSGIYTGSHSMAGLGGFMGCVIAGPEAEFPTGDNPLATPSGVLALITGCIKGIGEFLAPKDAIDNQIVSIFSDIVLGVFIINKGLFSGIGQGILTNKRINKRVNMGKMAASDARGIGALIDCFLVIPAVIVTEWHFYELCQKPAGQLRSAAIVGECSSLASYVARLSYGIAVNDDDPNTRQVAIAAHVSGLVCSAGLQVAEACIN